MVDYSDEALAEFTKQPEVSRKDYTAEVLVAFQTNKKLPKKQPGFFESATNAVNSGIGAAGKFIEPVGKFLEPAKKPILDALNILPGGLRPPSYLEPLLTPVLRGEAKLLASNPVTRPLGQFATSMQKGMDIRGTVSGQSPSLQAFQKATPAAKSSIESAASNVGGFVGGAIPDIALIAASDGLAAAPIFAKIARVFPAINKSKLAVGVIRSMLTAPGFTLTKKLISEGKIPTAADFGKDLMFFGAAPVGSELTGKLLERVLPNLPKLISAPMEGAASGVAGLTATTPFMSPEERKNIGTQYGPTALAQAVFHTMGKLGETPENKAVLPEETVKATDGGLLDTGSQGVKSLHRGGINPEKYADFLDTFTKPNEQIRPLAGESILVSGDLTQAADRIIPPRAEINPVEQNPQAGLQGALPVEQMLTAQQQNAQAGAASGAFGTTAGQQNANVGVTSGAFGPQSPTAGQQTTGRPAVQPPAAVAPPASEAVADVTKAMTDVLKIKDDIQRVFAPSGRTPEARGMADTVRANTAELARKREIVYHSLEEAGKQLAKLPDVDKLNFMDNIETGKTQAEPVLDGVAKQLRTLLDQRRIEVQKLGTGKLEHFIQDYFPHIWEDPVKAQDVFAQVFGKKPLEGPKSFLKRRTIPTIKEGIALGLKPVSMNPVDLTMLKVHEMDRYIMAQKIAKEGKQWGIKFVSSGTKPPEGMTKINDNMFTVYGPPKETIKEAYDEKLMAGLTSLAKSLGVDVQRKINVGGKGRWGYAQGDKVVTKFGGPETILTHEIGHILDDKYGLGLQLKRLSQPGMSPWRQLDALADLRMEGQNATSPEALKFKAYARSAPEKVANLVHAYIHTPELLRRVAPLAEDVLNDVINAHPELEKLREIKPSLVLGENSAELNIAGMRIMGYYYAPEQVATILNNYLSPGLKGKPLYEIFRQSGNTMNQLQLGMSAFHALFTSVDAAISKTALGLEQVSMGKFGKGGLNVLKGITPGYAPVENMLRGSKVLKEYFAPGSQGADIKQMVDALVAGGGRAKMDSFYKNSAAANFLEALKGTKEAAAQGRYPEAAYRGAKAVPKALFALIEKTAAPIMEWLVPRQKLGVFADIAQQELERLGPGATREQVRATMRDAWDSVDNRMGQMVYDNLFWKKTLKDIGMLSVRSLGWNLGTFREVGGGMADVVGQTVKAVTGKRDATPFVTHRMAYVVALPAVVGLYGAILNYLYTGKGPDELKDYFFIPTGKTKPNGDPERVSLPSYMKDIYAYGKAPLETLSHKIHPVFSAISEMLSNKDYFGNKIYNTDDPGMKQLTDGVNFVGSQFLPFSFRNFQQRKQSEGTTADSVQSFFGITPAPSSIDKTRAEELMSKHLRDRMPVGGRTPEEVAKSKIIHDLVQKKRRGEDIQAEILGLVKDKTINARQVQRVYRIAKEDPLIRSFKMLTVGQAQKVYDLGTDEEKQLWKPYLARKIKRQ